MKVLVTGGAGYVGSCLLPMLLEAGHDVTMIDMFMFGCHPIMHIASHPQFTVINDDVRNEGVIKKHLKGKDLIIHLASIVGFPACARDESAAVSTNLGSTKLIVDNMEMGQHLFYASSGSSYGRVKEICTEEVPINPLTLYGRTKAESEAYIFNSKHGKNSIAFRFATAFGVSPRIRLDLLVNDFVYKALHDKIIVLFEGHFRRTFLHVKDCAYSYIHMIDRIDSCNGEIYNVGSNDMNYTKKEVALMIQKKVNYELYEAGVGKDLDERDYEVSYDKIIKTGFSNTIDFETGLNELIKVLTFMKLRMEFRNA
ncbi:SDR family oxidoreductase [bacterium]|nr:SDR family oxidoreductase [FCB group bacterium]MBL7191673.1 SDR family oxidoreductase [bacterium]